MHEMSEIKKIAKSASFAPESVYGHFMKITTLSHPSRDP